MPSEVCRTKFLILTQLQYIHIRNMYPRNVHIQSFNNKYHSEFTDSVFGLTVEEQEEDIQELSGGGRCAFKQGRTGTGVERVPLLILRI